MIYLKQSTAVNIKIGPFLDDTDGKTAETGLSIATADVRLSKNGGANGAKNSTTATSHNELGYYNIHLNATDTNTLGALKVMVSKEGALPVWADFMVVTSNVYDTFFSTGSLNVNAASLSTDAITAASVKAEAVTKIQSGLATSANLQTVDDNVDAIKAKTDNIPASPAAVGSAMTLTSAYDAAKNAASQASVNAIPTTPLLAANYTAPNNQGIADIKAKTDNLPASPAAVGSLMNLADGAITDAKIASNAISAAKIASNAIAGAKIATDAVTKIQTGLSTADNLAIVDGLIDTLIARLTETRAGNLDKLAIGAGNTLAHTGNANTFKADVSALAKTTDLTPLAKTTDLTGVAKSSEVEAAKNAIIEAMPDIDLSTIPDDLLSKIIVGELTVEQVLKVLAAIELGTTIGGGTSNITYTGKDGTKVTLSGVDENGNRGVVNVEFED